MSHEIFRLAGASPEQLDVAMTVIVGGGVVLLLAILWLLWWDRQQQKPGNKRGKFGKASRRWSRRSG